MKSEKATTSLAGHRRASASDTRIGIITPGYGLEKVSYLLDPPGYRFQKVRRLPVHRIARPPRSSFWQESALMLPNRVALIHTFNTIPLNGGPFVLSFESELPRLLGEPSDRAFKLSLDALEHSRCRGLLALSERAAANARISLAERGRPALARRVQVFRGALLPPRSPRTAPAGAHQGGLRLLFVGGDLLGKGFLPTLRAVRRLRDGGLDLHLHVVGRLDPSSYVVAGCIEPESIDPGELFSAPWITYQSALPNPEIRALMASADLLLFPSLDESLGWVVVEAGLEGLPAITTGIFALPELTLDGVTGRTIPIPANRFGRWTGLFETGKAKRETYDSTAEIIELGIEQAIAELDGNRDRLAAWSSATQAHLGTLYDFQAQSSALAQLYNEGLNRVG